MFETEFQDFPGLFELKTPIFPGPNLFFPGLITAANHKQVLSLDDFLENKGDFTGHTHISTNHN